MASQIYEQAFTHVRLCHITTLFAGQKARGQGRCLVDYKGPEIQKFEECVMLVRLGQASSGRSWWDNFRSGSPLMREPQPQLAQPRPCHNVQRPPAPILHVFYPFVWTANIVQEPRVRSHWYAGPIEASVYRAMHLLSALAARCSWGQARKIGTV